MSIIDHQPKYAKLRAWREAYREKMIGEYHSYIEKYMLPPRALLRWIQQARRDEDGLLPVLTPMRQLVVRLSVSDPTVYKLKSIQEMIAEKEGAK